MKNKIFSILYGIVLAAFTAYVLLDAFVIERVYTVIEDSKADSTEEHSEGSKEAVVTADSYDDGNIKISLAEHRLYNTTVYVADVTIKSPQYIKTAFAKDKYGKNIKEKTSVTAESKGAVLAVNGDYYSARSSCVLRNGTLYREFSGDSDDESLVIGSGGAFSFVHGGEGDGEALVKDGAMQVLSFGPALLENGVVCVGVNDEVDKAMRNNPRTALVWYGDLHYAFIVADGRTKQSTGLTLYQLAEFAKELGAKDAYNLDGGGSSTMYFCGRVVNNPTTNGNKISEREVSDIVYIGY